ncbi:hypothetical protein [Acinetobacter towneri]|uniref:hypothetical protein n=1 Tax=Acinetobacter towneri TaxID=202956 RepID=UPI001F1A3536|nr:hypothetical protein [Acinetobacter towneri]UIP26505.1 hypothetical protein LZG54_11800 [Acinetobacter towneri]
MSGKIDVREIDALVDAQNGRITPSMAHSYLFGRQLSKLRFNGADFRCDLK